MSISYPVNIKTTEIENEAVTEPKIAKEAIGTSKLGNNVVTFGKTLSENALPAKPAEKAVSEKVNSTVRKATFAITGDGVKTEWPCSHGLFAWATLVFAYEKGAAEKETKKNIAITSFENVSNTETKVTLGVAVAAGVVAYITVCG